VRIVGLTGGIGSGKSTVARLLADRGAVIIDADRLAREAVKPGSPGLAAVVAQFGPAILDATGALDRPKLGALVFADETARRALNAIVHPIVAQLSAEAFEAARASGAKVAIYDVPLLFENGLERTLPETVVVSVSPATQRARIAARDALPAEQIEQRIAAQLPLADKAAKATWVIDNDGSKTATEAQVEALWKKWLGGS
jgi:dephospho-CoA kinase